MLATAEALADMEPAAQITCVGTRAGLETSVVPQAGFTLELVDPVPLPRSVTPGLFTMPVRLAKAVGQAKDILGSTRAQVVVGFGGYAALPVFLAAWRMGIPVVVHEANAVPGLANRIASRFAVDVCVTFANSGLPHQIVTGMPVRKAVADLDREAKRSTARHGFGLEDDAKVLLVSGGSQGARTLNQATVAARQALNDAGISILHVTGPKNYAETVDLPASTSAAYLRVPYVQHMEEAYAAADLMLARSGAGTVAETAIVGLPAIFVPLPHGNGEQAKNAAGVVDAQGGILIEDGQLTGERLATEVIQLFTDPQTLVSMGHAARHVMPRDAAKLVARCAVDLAGNQATP